MELFDTAGGTEESISNPFYTAGQWIHLLITMNDGGTNASTVKFYKNGSLFDTSSADLSPPLGKTRTEQFIGRSTSDLKYFQGDLDDLRLYDVVLTDSEITTLYGEAATGIHYQAQALNNPTGFSATGLPSGLTIDPITGAITGHTTSVGDHNITLTASNLSGTSPGKEVTLSVTAEKPLFELAINTTEPKIVTIAVGSNSATVAATLLETGGSDTTLEVFYGTADKGITTSGWDLNTTLSATQSTGEFELGMTGLSASTSYVYRVRASNSAGSTWSDAFSFTTGSTPTPPGLSVSKPTVVGTTTATTKGNLLSFDGTTNPTITLYYGTSDGNQTPANWTASPVSLSTKPVGPLDHNLTGLTAGTSYYYRYFATTTISSTAYSTYSDLGTFTTLAPPTVQTLAVSPIDKTKATLNAKPTLSGNDTASITFFWGDNDGSNSGNHNQWDQNFTVSGTHSSGAVISYPITGLTTGTTYYAVARVTNSLNTSAYGSVVSFKAADRTFTRHSIPGLVLWLDATDVDGNGNPDSLGDGSSISAWIDKSTKGVTVNQTNSGNQPIYKSASFGSKPAVRFDGIDDVLNLTPIRSTAGGYSVYVATRRHDTLGDDYAHIIDEAGWNLVADATNQSYAPKILAKSAASHATLTNLKIGKDAGGTNNDFGGDVGEILIFERKLSSTEEAKIVDYLVHKWEAHSTATISHIDVPPLFDNTPKFVEKPYISGYTVNFSPSELSNLSYWLDAQDSSTITKDGSNKVEKWADKSGNDKNATMSTENRRPTYVASDPVLNGKPSVKNSSSAGQVGLDIPTSRLWEIFMVGYYNDGIVNNFNTYNTLFSGDDYRSRYKFRGQENTDYSSSSWTFDTSPSMNGYADSATILPMPASVLRFKHDTHRDQITYLLHGYSDESWLGGIGEMIALSSTATVEEAKKIEGYLAHKWGTAHKLIASHPHYNRIDGEVGTALSFQLEAIQGPETWTADSTLAAKGLSLNSSTGLITGTPNAEGNFTTAITVANSGGSEQRNVFFNITKGTRVIDWNQTFAGITYGDNNFLLSGTATGSNNLYYSSSDSSILEINGSTIEYPAVSNGLVSWWRFDETSGSHCISILPVLITVHLPAQPVLEPENLEMR
jgi:hypothetical protein